MNYIKRDLFQFYPTPENQARRMARKVPNGAFNIIDPQAGEGALLDAVKKQFEHGSNYGRRKNYYACEINENRQHILVGKKYNVITDDFLTLDNPHLYFSCIIMNPPFIDGIKHFLKAWGMLEQNGTIICLLNESSISNTTKEGVLFNKIIKASKAELEFQENVFTHAERRTTIKTVLITAKKEEKDSKFKFLNEKWSEDLEQEKADLISPNEQTTNGLVKYDYIDTIVAQYNITKKTYAEVFESHRKINFYSPVSFSNNILQSPSSFEDFEKELRSGCWRKIFQETKLVNYMSTGMIKEFQKLEEEQANRVFNKNNIVRVLDAIMQNFEKVRISVIEEAFDNCTKFYTENRNYKEGWKTNDSYKINKKVILPNIWASYMSQFSLSTTRSTTIGDLERALCLLIGEDFTNLQNKWSEKLSLKSRCSSTIEQVLNKAGNKKFNQLHDSEFFTFRVFMKGTIHLTFKDSKLWEMFNTTVAASKKWIGKDEKR